MAEDTRLRTPAGDSAMDDVNDAVRVNVVTGTVTEASGAAIAASASVLDDWDESDRAKVNPIVGQAGVQGGSGAVSALTQRVVLATDVALPTGTNSIGAVTNTPLTNMGAGEYETVAASQTAQPLGATGATGDYIAGVLVIPATTSPGNVLLLDNATSITIFTGGASSVSNLVPFFIPLGMISVSGAWKLTTGASVSCIGIGNFT